MRFDRNLGLCLGAALLCGSSLLNPVLAKPFMIVGLDEKVWWDDDGKNVLSLPGKDQVLIVDVADPENPKIVTSLPLKNSIVGPPVNLDINPAGTVALVAYSTPKPAYTVLVSDFAKTIWRCTGATTATATEAR